MIWVAWRQFRTQALVTLGLLAAFAALVLVTGLHLRDVYSSLGGAHCSARADCSVLSGELKPIADLLGPALLAIPALLGMFWGAPLIARELETGTYRLAWTQSVTRRRWLSVRVALVGVAALAVAGVASWLVSWWFAPLDAVSLNRFDPSVFTERGIVAIGYAGFAFALGVTAGALLRRTLPAMAATLLGFIAARIAFTLWVRPHLLASRHVLFPLTFGKDVGLVGFPSDFGVFAGLPPLPNAWGLSSALVDRAHHALSAPQLHELFVRTCPTLAANLSQNPGAGPGKGPGGLTGGVFSPCLHALSHHLQLLVAYQPASHYWPLQALETAIFLAAGFALIGATVWRVGRRVARKPAVGERRERTADPLALEVAPEIGMPPVRPREDSEKSAPRATITERAWAGSGLGFDWLSPLSTERNRTLMRCRRPTILTSVIAAAAVSLFAAGCGGDSPTTGATTTAATQNGALAYARCMRSHGVRNFPDPTSSGGNDKVAIVSALQRVGNSQAQATQVACMHVNGGSPGTSQSAAQGQAQTDAMLAFARCMRGRGLADFPDPTHGELSPEMVTAAGIDLHQPAVLRAGLACTSVTHGLLTRASVERAVNGG